MKTLKYWYITGFRKGEWKGCMAHGIVHGHQRLADGILIHTSAISAVTVEQDMAIIRTKNPNITAGLMRLLLICSMSLESDIFSILRTCGRSTKGGWRCPDRETGH